MDYETGDTEELEPKATTYEEVIAHQQDALWGNIFLEKSDLTPDDRQWLTNTIRGFSTARERFELVYAYGEHIHAATLYEAANHDKVEDQMQELRRLLNEQNFTYSESDEPNRVFMTSREDDDEPQIVIATFPLIKITSLVRGVSLPDDVEEICIDMRSWCKITNDEAVQELLRNRTDPQFLDHRAKDKVIAAILDPDDDRTETIHTAIYLHIRRRGETDRDE